MSLELIIGIILRLFPDLDPKAARKALQCVPWAGVQSASLDGAELVNLENPQDLPYDMDIHLTSYVLEAWHDKDYYRLTVPYVSLLGQAGFKVNGIKTPGVLSGTDDADSDITIKFGDHALTWIRERQRVIFCSRQAAPSSSG